MIKNVVMSQNIPNNGKLQKRSNWTSKRAKCELRRKSFKTAKLQKWSKYNDLHRFDVKSNHITMNLHRFDVKTIKATQNSKRDQITMNLHRFDVQTIKNVELRRKPFETAKLQKWSKYNDLDRFDVKSNHITMNLHRFDVKTSIMSR